MVIRYEIEFKGRALSITQEINPDGSASANNKPDGKVKPRPEEEQIAFSRRADRCGSAGACRAAESASRRLSSRRPKCRLRGRKVSRRIREAEPIPLHQGPGGSGSLNGLVIVFGPVICATAGRAGRRRRRKS